MSEQSTNTAVAEKPSRVAVFMGEVLPPSKRAEVMSSLPAHISPVRFERNLSNALMREPKLLNCDPRVVFREVSKVAALGLLLDPQLGECWLIADRNNDVQARVGYRGLIKLARQSGEIDNPFAMDICENDFCEIIQGTNRSLTHKPDYTKDRGKPVAYYAVVGFKEGKPDFEVMSASEIHSIRDRSDAWKAFKKGLIKSTPWGTDDGEMSKKTVLRRLLKRCPMSPELADLLASEDRADERDMRDVTPTSNLSALQQRLQSTGAKAPIDMVDHVDQETGEVTNSDRGSPAAKDTEATGDGAQTASESSVSTLSPREEGRAAYHGSGTESDCPAYRNKADREEWLAGFREGNGGDDDTFPGDR